MAEFCLSCWNKINNIHDGPEEYVISKELELCEGCGKWKHTIVTKRRRYNTPKRRFLFRSHSPFTFFIHSIRKNLQKKNICGRIIGKGNKKRKDE